MKGNFSDFVKNLKIKNNVNIAKLNLNFENDIKPEIRLYYKNNDKITNLIKNCNNVKNCSELLKFKDFYNDKGIDPNVALFYIKNTKIPLTKIGSPIGSIFKVVSYEILEKNGKLSKFQLDFDVSYLDIKINNKKINKLGNLIKHCIDQVNKYPILLNKELYDLTEKIEKKRLSSYDENPNKKEIKLGEYKEKKILNGGSNDFAPALKNNITSNYENLKNNFEKYINKDNNLNVENELSFYQLFNDINFMWNYYNRHMYVLSEYLKRYLEMKESGFKDVGDILDIVNKYPDFKMRKGNNTGKVDIIKILN